LNSLATGVIANRQPASRRNERPAKISDARS
jgi:hypothetical protein